MLPRVFGKKEGEPSLDLWTPPTCVVLTTAAPTTTTTPATTVSDQEGAMDAAKADNDALKAKINGLKQQYGPIGHQATDF